MDNHGTPAPSNFHIRWYVAHQKIQDPSICWPFGEICEYSRNIDLSCRVPLSNRRGRKIVEAPEPSARRNTEADNVVDEHHQAIPMVISSRRETDSGDDTAYEAERKRKGKAHEIPSAEEAEERRKGKAAAHEISSDVEMDIPREGETDSEDDDGEYERQLSIAIHESWESFYNSGVNLNSRALPTVIGPARGAETEYERQLNVAIQESLQSFNNSGSHALRTVTGPARGNIGNDSVMELTNTSHCPNEDSVDEGAQTEALDAVRDIYNPSLSTSALGQASGANAVGHETDLVVPFLEPMVCVINRNPMDFTIEEAKKYMRTE